MKKYVFLILLFSQFVFSQSVEIEEVIQNFDGAKNWQIPISRKQTTQGIAWQERISSFSSEGIKTFVGYADNQLVSVISIYKNQVAGSVSWKGKNYQISTKNSKIIVKEDKSKGGCGTCLHGCNADNHSGNHSSEEKINSSAKTLKISSKETPSIIPSDDILRIYRLAILVDYSAVSTYFQGNLDKVKAFWSEVEVFLNEAYTRDVGVKFTIVNDERLIITDETKRRYRAEMTSGAIMSWSTSEINAILGDNNYDEGRKQYDAGVSVAVPNGNSARGMASLGGVYRKGLKGAVFADAFAFTISHELGHLFGADHTFTVGGQDTYQTEPEQGTSMMSYGQYEDKDNFFSLFSISQMRKEMKKHAWYYADNQRVTIVGEPTAEANIVYGIKTENKAPIIDRNHLKISYQLPPETSFQFDIKATDPEQKSLLFSAHQTDFKYRRTGKSDKTKFYSHKPQSENIVRFDPEYYTNLVNFSNGLKNYTQFKASDRGEFTFWVAALDSDPENQHHKSRLDATEIKVEVKSGTPFKFTSKVGNLDNQGKETRKYNGGQKTTLTWSVDKAIFGEDSRVRILMSDDFGKSWKYILTPDTENDGSHEIIIPDIDLTERITHERHRGKTASSGKGLFRIEVLDHIATAITDDGAKPVNGGFEIHKSKIQFTDKPTPIVKIKRKDLPLAVFPVKATTSCGASEVKITSEDKEENSRITRIWTAKDDCGNTAYISQYIEIEEVTVVPIVWVENSLPKNENYTCRASVPAKSTDNLRVTGGQGNVKFAVSESVENEQCTNKVTIKRIFTASENSMQLTHTQIIMVNDNEKPTFVGTLPQNIEIFEDETIPAQENLTATDNCGTATVIKTETREIGKVTYIWAAKDDCGNQVVHNQIITIKPRPVQPIVWVENSLPKNTKVSCENIPVIATNLQANGGCSTLTILHKSDEISAKICTNSYKITRIYEAKDNCGNSKMHTQTIEVEDVTKPTFVGTLPQNIEIFEGENIPAQENLTATDNCGTATVTKTETRENGKVMYIWTAKDDCGNQVVHNQIITIKPRPVQPIVWVENSLPKNENYTCRASVSAKSTDNLRVTGGQGNVKFAVSESVENEQCTNKVTIKRIFTASENSMQLTHTQIITVNDNEKPTFIGNLPQNIEIFEDETTPAQENLTATDNCGTATVTKTEIRENGKITYIWTAKDDCGNEVVHTQIITIKPRPIQPIVWVENSLPKDENYTCRASVPAKSTDNLQVTGGQGNVKFAVSESVENEQCTNKVTIKRIFTASENSMQLAHTQIITVNDNEKPTFVGTLPQNIEIFEDETIPAQENLTATDNCGTATVTKTESRESGKVTYIWTAKDDCGNQVVHTQIITLKKKEKSEVPKNPEIPKNPNPIKNSAEMVIYNAISTENGSENYFRIENLSENSVVRVQIFSNLGEKVYESDAYGQNNMFFRGYSNVKDISNTEKLPEGVYYYLLWINNEPKPRKGYLYVR